MFRLACVAVLLAAAGAAYADVGDYVGQPIASVRLVVDGRDVVDPALARLVEVHAGAPLSMRDVRDTVLHLFAMGRFDDVRVDASRQGNGVGLRFDLTAARRVNEIRFAGKVGEPGVDEGQLRRAVMDRAGPTPPV
ncbi:MAG TPA: hypothetical protein VN628_18380, partial [Vicinamibacterales bacterium]|nr:hypothetical protein [Vicinamibacterales bacterium]